MASPTKGLATYLGAIGALVAAIGAAIAAIKGNDVAAFGAAISGAYVAAATIDGRMRQARDLIYSAERAVSPYVAAAFQATEPDFTDTELEGRTAESVTHHSISEDAAYTQYGQPTPGQVEANNG